MRSPLKSRPLRLPGQSVDEALQSLLWDAIGPYVAIAFIMVLIAGEEWLATLTHMPRQPWLYTSLAFIASSYAAFKILRVRDHIRQLRLGRDGERAVGEFLERLRADGAVVFHDVPGDNFNIDHVVLSVRGFFAIETKTRSKPEGDARVVLTETGVLVNGFPPDRDPIVQAQSGAKWLSQLLEESTGKRFPVRGVVLFPGWYIEPMSAAWRRSPEKPWVLEPKALPAFIENEPDRIAESDLSLAAFHLSRYVRTTEKNGGR